MSSASDFREKARNATAVYEVVGGSGAVYIIFWFSDHSVCAARRLPSDTNRAAARYEFLATKPCLDDCGMADFEGTTYQKGQELLRQLQEG